MTQCREAKIRAKPNLYCTFYSSKDTMCTMEKSIKSNYTYLMYENNQVQLKTKPQENKAFQMAREN